MTRHTAGPAVTVRMPGVLPLVLAAIVTAAGAGAGFAVAPLVRWLRSTFDAAPWPLRFLAELPTGWAVLVAGLFGLLAGCWLAVQARTEAPEIVVAADHVEIACRGQARWIDRAEVAGVLRDGAELVLLDEHGTEPARVAVSDLSGRRLRAAFTGHGYPWREDAADGSGFVPWVDGRPGLTAAAHGLLRARSRALESGERGSAADLQQELRSAGVPVRDRKGVQQVRFPCRS